MPILRVSLEQVERLLVTQLAAVSGITFVERGHEDPSTAAGGSSQPWCRLLQVECEDSIRNTASMAYADVSGIVGLVVPGDLIIANAYALSQHLDTLATLLSFTRMVNSLETLSLTMHGCRRAQDVDPIITDAPDRHVASGGILFSGKAIVKA